VRRPSPRSRIGAIANRRGECLPRRYERGEPSSTGALHVVGFAAFVIDSYKWQSSPHSSTHTLTGNIVAFVTSRLGSGPGTGSNGETVVGLDR
jgi:hypothetical protein